MEDKIKIEPSEKSVNYLAELGPEELTLEVISSPAFVEAYPILCNTLDILSGIKKNVDGAIKNIAKDKYMENGETHIETDSYKVTFVAGTVTRKFNVSKFKADHPDLYEEYLEESLSSDSIRIKMKGE